MYIYCENYIAVIPDSGWIGLKTGVFKLVPLKLQFEISNRKRTS